MWCYSRSQSSLSSSFVSHVVRMPINESPLESFRSLNFSGEKEIRSFWKSKVEEASSFLYYINAGNWRNVLKDGGKLVGFRGMVQDSLESELYPGVERYKDIFSHEDGEYNNNLKERWVYYAVSLPGETPWILENWNEGSLEAIPSGSVLKVTNKRPLEDEEPEDVPMTPVENNKKPKVQTQTESHSSWGLNFPIPSQPGACSVLLKVYDEAPPNIAINEPIDFYGILSCDEQGAEETSPPSTLVPRMHVVFYQKLVHTNPLLPPILSSSELGLSTTREQFLSVLTNLCFGDCLAAEYLLCHLISKVYTRRDVHCLGKYSLNMLNVPLHGDYVSRLSSFLSNVLCLLHYFPMTIQNLNCMTFIPRKDYSTNRLESGLLQLSPSTHLILDETRLDVGQLSPNGLKNITALGNLITWQKAEYNFSYYPMEFSTDVPCLIFSEGRSMLPNDVQIPLRPNHSTSHSVIDEKFRNLNTDIISNDKLLKEFRKYLTLARHHSYSLTEEIQKSVQEDFVNERVNNNNFSAQDLSDMLILARLVSLSHGKSTLTNDLWVHVKDMETMRKARLSQLPSKQASAVGQSGIFSKLSNIP